MPFPERSTTVPVPRPPFRVAVAQVEPTLGNLKKNLAIHLDAIEAARADGADLLVFPELSLTGYYLKDQVPEVAEPRDGPLSRAIREASGPMAVVYGFVEESPSARFYNAAAFSDPRGGVSFVHRKVYLPTYGMFDEGRYFAAGSRVMAFDSRFGRLGLLICEDAWHLSCGVISRRTASTPHHRRQLARPGRPRGAARQPEELGTRHPDLRDVPEHPVVFANRVGFEDGVNFWGGSAIVGRAARGWRRPRVRRLPDLGPSRPQGHPPGANPGTHAPG